MRGGPGTGHPIVGALGNGEEVRNLGCKRQADSTWCEMEMMTDMRERGWVNARYLASAGAGGSSRESDYGRLGPKQQGCPSP